RILTVQEFSRKRCSNDANIVFKASLLEVADEKILPSRYFCLATARENVKVTVRLRPPNETELTRTDFNIWDVDFNEHKLSLEQIFAEKNRKQISEFFYDEIFTGSDNKALFDRGVKDTI
ncbi:23036_t:CDS:2, partial [Entrophospora sp. SA101]